MSEPTSNPNPHSDTDNELELARELAKVPEIAREEAKTTEQDQTLAEKELAAVADGKSDDAAFAEQLGQKEAKSEEEIKRLKNENLELQNKTLELKNQRLTSRVAEEEVLHKVRRTYTNKLFTVTLIWLGVVITFVVANGFKFKTKDFSFNLDNGENFALYFYLSDSVLVAFITSTTVAVIGLFVIVAKWLFQPSVGVTDHEEAAKKTN